MNLILKTSRLILKPTSANDLKTLHDIAIDPYVRKYLCDDKMFSWQQTKEMLEESQRLFATEKLSLWLIELKTEREVIGFTGLWYFFGENQPQLVYALVPKATKKGYATEAAKRVLEYCFERLNYNYLIASCDRANLESHRAAKRLGMKQTKLRNIDDNPILFFRIDRRS